MTGARVGDDRRSSWPKRRDSAGSGGGGSNKDMRRASLRNLLLDVSGMGMGSQQKIYDMNLQRRNSLRDMDVPKSSVPNLKLDSSSHHRNSLMQPRRESSVVFNRKQGSKAAPKKLFEVVITKPTPEDSWGFSFNRFGSNNGEGGGIFFISEIKRGSHTDQQTSLEVGDLIQSIDHVDLIHHVHGNDHFRSVDDVKNLLKKEETSLTIRAKKPTLAERTYVEAWIHKEAKGDSLGFEFGRSPQGKLAIKSTVAGGLAVRQTNLRPGYEILEIDGVNCGSMSVEEANELVFRKDEVLIRGRKPVLVPGTCITTTITKDTIGLVLAAGGDDRKPVIFNIHHDSPAYHTQLEPGQIIESINGSSVMGHTVEQVSNILINAPEGPLTIQARVV